jgi:hypothetical protein
MVGTIPDYRMGEDGFAGGLRSMREGKKSPSSRTEAIIRIAGRQ